MTLDLREMEVELRPPVSMLVEEEQYSEEETDEEDSEVGMWQCSFSLD